jgi:hypothetical protein
MAMTKWTAREELLRSAIQGGLSEEDALLWMALLHTHEIHLRPGALDDLDDANGVVLPSDTRRGVAAVIAALWRKHADPLRTGYVYWYNAYGQRTPYEMFESAPPAHQERIRQFRELLERDERVSEIRPEE